MTRCLVPGGFSWLSEFSSYSRPRLASQALREDEAAELPDGEDPGTASGDEKEASVLIPGEDNEGKETVPRTKLKYDSKALIALLPQVRSDPTQRRGASSASGSALSPSLNSSILLEVAGTYLSSFHVGTHLTSLPGRYH